MLKRRGAQELADRRPRLSLRQISYEAKRGEQPKPNVLFILADNVGYGDIGAYGGGEQEITIAEMLHDAGYATAMFGKWHLGSRPYSQPQNKGFDEFYGIPPGDTWDAFLLIPHGDAEG